MFLLNTGITEAEICTARGLRRALRCTAQRTRRKAETLVTNPSPKPCDPPYVGDPMKSGKARQAKGCRSLNADSLRYPSFMSVPSSRKLFDRPRDPFIENVTYDPVECEI